MLLSDKEIKKHGLIHDGLDSNFRAISYDVTIGRIIETNGRKRNSLILRPQGIVEVVSKEKVKLPRDIAGYAMVKTSLCNEGILPLNIGRTVTYQRVRLSKSKDQRTSYRCEVSIR